MSDVHDSGTLAWYLAWLSERNPEWTDEQRLEIATGFVTAQLPPARPIKDEDSDDGIMERLKEAHAAERKARRYLTSKELMEILQTPGAIPKVS
jgi:hypothetical protein